MSDPDRWHLVERMYHATLAYGESERAAFLRDACRGDEPLRREIESLLAYADEAQAFMQGSAFETAAAQIQSGTTTPSVGFQLGPYEIRELLGSGGMGDVYRARALRVDTRPRARFAVAVRHGTGPEP